MCSYKADCDPLGRMPRGQKPPVQTFTKAAETPEIVEAMRGQEMRKRLRTGHDWFDDLITRITGKALPGQKPFFKLSGPILWLLSTLNLFAHIGILTLLVASLAEPSWWSVALIPLIGVGLVSLTGRFRVQVVSFGHMFLHGFGAKSPSFNGIAAHVATALGLGANPDDYRKEHLGLNGHQQSASIYDPIGSRC